MRRARGRCGRPGAPAGRVEKKGEVGAEACARSTAVFFDLDVLHLLFSDPDFPSPFEGILSLFFFVYGVFRIIHFPIHCEAKVLLIILEYFFIQIPCLS